MNSVHYKTMKLAVGNYNEIERTFIYFEKVLEEKRSILGMSNVQMVLDKKQEILKCFLTAYHTELCVYNGSSWVGYTLLKNMQILRIYGTSSLSILNHFPKYIICTDLYSSLFDFCRIAQEVPEEMIGQFP